MRIANKLINNREAHYEENGGSELVLRKSRLRLVRYFVPLRQGRNQPALRLRLAFEARQLAARLALPGISPR